MRKSTRPRRKRSLGLRFLGPSWERAQAKRGNHEGASRVARKRAPPGGGDADRAALHRCTSAFQGWYRERALGVKVSKAPMMPA